MQQEVILPPYDLKMVSEQIKDEEIEEIPGALETGRTKIDPVTFSVVLARLEGIISEMTATVLSTARNPILGKYGNHSLVRRVVKDIVKRLFFEDHSGVVKIA